MKPITLALFTSGLALICAFIAMIIQVVFLLAVSGAIPGVQVVRNPATMLHPYELRLKLEPQPEGS